MRVDYCDLCGQPLKENDNYILYMIPSTEENSVTSVKNYFEQLQKIEKEIKDICPTCKTIIEKIFELRLQNLNKISNELLAIFNLPPIPNPKERRKNGKKKRK